MQTNARQQDTNYMLNILSMDKALIFKDLAALKVSN
jgi:hypothetical protein